MLGGVLVFVGNVTIKKHKSSGDDPASARIEIAE
jgi:hypothetical protein